MAIGIIFIVSAFADEDGFQEGFNRYYNSEPNRYALVAYIAVLMLLGCLIVFFTSSLIWLHIKLYKWGLTAYEFIVYKDEKQERLEALQSGLITQEQYDEEEKKALEDIRKKKKSSIIHQINQENKKAYKQRIIERNKKAREAQKKAEEDKSMGRSSAPEKKSKLEVVKEANNGEFDDISKTKVPDRVNNYQTKKQNPSTKSSYPNVVMNGRKQSENDSPIAEKRPPSHNSPSKSHKFDEDFSKGDNASLDSDSLERAGSDSLMKESDINDRDSWEMKKNFKKEITNNHISRMEKESPSDLSSEK